MKSCGLKQESRMALDLFPSSISLGPLNSRSLPAYHALTGCDTKSAFSGIGKKKARKVFVEDSEAQQQQLAGLGEEPLLTQPLQKSCEAFVY